MAHSLEPQQHGLAQGPGEALQRALEPVPLLPGYGVPLGALGAGVQVVARVTAVEQESASGGGSRHVGRGAVVRDAQHEGPKRCLAPERRESPPEREGDVLEEIVLGRGVALDGTYEARDGAPMLVERIAEGLLLLG